MTYKAQIEKLMDELKENSDSESFDDEMEKILNMEKALEVDRMKSKIKILESEAAKLKFETRFNNKRFEDNLTQTRNTNMSLKKDYDLL